MEVKISELEPVDNLFEGCCFPLVQNDETRKVTFKTILTEVLQIQNPVGHIRIETTDVNPSEYLGFGTWVLWGSGRVPVGVDTSQEEFNTVEKIGGEKTHTLTEAEMPRHRHNMGNEAELLYVKGVNSGVNITGVMMSETAGWWTESWKGAAKFQASGNNQPHNNLQPFITCYMWKRID